jgi:hypothetical protein
VMLEILNEIYELVTGTIETLTTTCQRIESISFEDSGIYTWLGYAHYVMGSPLYELFTSVMLIGVGVTLWTYLLKGIGYIKNLLPW